MYFTLYLVRKLEGRQTLTNSAATSTHANATGMLFPANAGLIFLTDELNRDKYLVDTGATLSIVPCKFQNHSIWPPSQKSRWTTYPLLGFCPKTVQFQGKLFSSQFLQAAVAGPILVIDFIRRFNVTVAPETSQIVFACTAAAPSPLKPS